MEITCGTLLHELQMIWDEVGETEEERDKLLLEMEQECLEVYRRKVNQTNQLRVELRQTIADSEAELAAICSALGEPPVHFRKLDGSPGGLKEELANIGPQLENFRKRKMERWAQFQEVVEQIQKIHSEIGDVIYDSIAALDDSNLSAKRFEELQDELETLKEEKADRLKQVIHKLSIIDSLCLVLGMDFKLIVGEIHLNLSDSEGVKNLSNSTIGMLESTIQELQKVKRQRILQLQDLVTSMLELWHLMDTPTEEQKPFQNVTCNLAASEEEITETNSLSENCINQIKAEVLRLEELKTSKIKELVLRKKSELVELRRQAHIVEFDANINFSMEAIESGGVDASFMLEQIESQISNAKEELFSRKEILEKVEKWMASCEEESWLEDYNRDENRYSSGKGSHLILKRAEKARLTTNKIPAMVDNLLVKINSWESQRGVVFTYDGVPLLSMLDEYNILRMKKEQDRRRQRDQRRIQGQLIAEQEVLYGSKSGSSKTQSTKKILKISTPTNSNRRMSFMHPTRLDLAQSPRETPRSARKAGNGERTSGHGHYTRQLSFNSSDVTVLESPCNPFTHMVHVPSPATLLTGDENQQPKEATLTVLKIPSHLEAMKTLKVSDDVHVTNDNEIQEAHEVEYSFEEKRADFRSVEC